MEAFCNWLFNNKEWLFSGAGLALLIALANIFKNIVCKGVRNSPTNLQQSSHIQQKTRFELKNDIHTLLNENRVIFEEYGPHCSGAYIPLHDAAIPWNRKVREAIIPNNDKILFYLNEYRGLLNTRELAIVQKFSIHAEAFKYNHISGDKNSSAPLFPKEMLSLLEDN